MNHQESRIIELEARVRQLSDVVACIPMAAAGLGLIPLDQYARAMESPLDAMSVLEKIAEKAEAGEVIREMFGVSDVVIAEMVAIRRRDLEGKISTFRR